MKFLKAVSLILFGTAVAKIWNAFGEASLLRETDPFFHLSFRALILFAAALELGVAAVCFFRPAVDGLVAVAWLSTVFLAYRIGLWWTGWTKPCSCLGNLTDALHISPQLADNVMKGLLAFMFIGSVSLLVAQRHGARAAAASASRPAPKTVTSV